MSIKWEFVTDNLVTILYGTHTKTLPKADFMEVLYKLVKIDPWPYIHLYEAIDSESLNTRKYIDMIDWVGLNLRRTAGIWLYADGIIRLNFNWSYREVHENDKCMFSYDAFLVSEGKNEVLYEKLVSMVL